LIAAKLEIPEEGQEEVAGTLINLYNLFLDKDATMVEINPFAEDAQGGKQSTNLQGAYKLGGEFTLETRWAGW
jgi:succinyl-CoA synthetase beta subunit